ncbi:hypothetical protein ACFL0Q_01285 [Thermodesulfobacteriota bacterium]
MQNHEKTRFIVYNINSKEHVPRVAGGVVKVWDEKEFEITGTLPLPDEETGEKVLALSPQLRNGIGKMTG